MTSLRLFVAIYPPPEVADALLAALPPQNIAPGRETPAEQIHLTCHFIGDRGVRELRDVRESIDRSCSGLGEIKVSPRDLIALPAGRGAKLIAAACDVSPAILELHRRLVIRFARPGKRADRFEPHLTLRRYGPAGGPRVSSPLAIQTFSASEVRLVQSVLHPSGAEHRVVHRVPVPVGG